MKLLELDGKSGGAQDKNEKEMETGAGHGTKTQSNLTAPMGLGGRMPGQGVDKERREP